MTEDTEVVREKTSALRGGMGEMLLRSHCISDRQCDKCGFENECIVRRIMYSKFENKPEFMHTGDSVGYIVHCSDNKKRFRCGDELRFSLYLFGRTIVYFADCLNAFAALGQSGLGRNLSRFEICAVKNLYGKDILSGNDIFMENYKWETLREYADRRTRWLQQNNFDGQMIFQTPVAIKYQGSMIQAFDRDAIAQSLLRRLYILACFEGADAAEGSYEPKEPFPKIIDSTAEEAGNYRYSSRKDENMKLRGIRGQYQI